jgi:Domain of unknown function (DUF4115)
MAGELARLVLHPAVRQRRYGGHVPETRVERVIFGLGIAAVAGIAVLIAFARSGGSATNPAMTATTARPAQAAHAPAAATTNASDGPRTQTGAQARPELAPSGVRLRLSAARAESWVEIRSGSAQGEVLFVGIMEEGSVRFFRAPRIYARFGRAGGLDVRLNDTALRLPPGTYSALITRQGVESVSAD